MKKITKIILFPITIIFMLLIKLYKWCISPLLPHCCRYYPTCSSYAILAIKEYGPIKGVWLAFKRISRCMPRNKSGFDPLPQNIKGDSKWIV
ncbi:MAG: membrane protein insertion efficiency factor YidD [Clostridia bacterium]|nr:membrane protein insertion efficiency factor YidD [Clostridia bacterium]